MENISYFKFYVTLLFYSFQPPLQTASSYGHHDIVQVLLNSGAYVDRFFIFEVNEMNLFLLYYFKCNLYEQVTGNGHLHLFMDRGSE